MYTFIIYIYIISDKKMAINKLELQWWWCRICFGVGGGFLLDFTLHYSLRNCAIHSELFYAIAHVCEFTRKKVLIYSKKERFMVAENYTSGFFFALGNCLCGTSFLLLVNCTTENAQTLTHFRHYQFILVNGFWYFNNILSRV